MAEKRWIRDYLAPLVTVPGADGLRDDVAALSPATIITTDTLVEGVHFLPDDPLETVAQKIVLVNVSDIVAKGAEPKEALLNITWPKGRSEKEFSLFARGLSAVLKGRNIALIGGDTVFHDGTLVLTLTLTGDPYANLVRRSGAKPGDGIYVTGKIGWGHCGLADGIAGRETEAAHRYRVPNVPGDQVAQLISTKASASMDISDGLLIDLRSLCDASGVGAAIDLNRIPLCKPTANRDEVLAQLTGGDDYQCLFTSSSDLSAVEGISQIGTMTEGSGLLLSLNGEQVATPEKLGFDHS